MKNKKNKIKIVKPLKSFKNLEEEARFWDTHDVALFFENNKTPLSKLPLIESEKEEILTIRIQKSVKEKIKHIAKEKGINPTTLSRMWLIEKLAQVR